MHALIAAETFPAKHVRFNDEEVVFASSIQYLRASERRKRAEAGIQPPEEPVAPPLGEVRRQAVMGTLLET